MHDGWSEYAAPAPIYARMNARRSMTRALAADAVAFSEHSGWSDGSASAPGWSASAANLRARGLSWLTIGWVEGFEINFLGAVLGFDIRRQALKFPGIGRVGVAAF